MSLIGDPAHGSGDDLRRPSCGFVDGLKGCDVLTARVVASRIQARMNYPIRYLLTGAR